MKLGDSSVSWRGWIESPSRLLSRGIGTFVAAIGADVSGSRLALPHVGRRFRVPVWLRNSRKINYRSQGRLNRKKTRVRRFRGLLSKASIFVKFGLRKPNDRGPGIGSVG